MENNNLILSALKAKLEAKRLEGLATLDIYIRNPVGIGEHPQVVEEAYNALKKIDGAESALSTLAQITTTPEKQKE
tara:strand:+ start:473 stop:700 length:228 start_codon:yes stop_codon:yes gene_type:complete